MFLFVFKYQFHPRWTWQSTSTDFLFQNFLLELSPSWFRIMTDVIHVLLQSYCFFYQHGQQWQPDPCTTCDCDDGVTHCQTKQCNNALWCPHGFTLQFDDTECCPRCVESKTLFVCFVFCFVNVFCLYNGNHLKYENKILNQRKKNQCVALPWF